MRDGAQWFVENTDIKLVGNDDPLQGEIAWNRTPRELGISAYALQQLGGSHAATSKQIRELMKVDGLTNDEVKSHLQVCICDYPSVFNRNLADVNKILYIHDGNWKPFCMLLVVNLFTHTCDYPR
ncbi:cyclase-like protein 2 isoform X1 [Malus sylvestris]|uniref:cyclase-like protein 2 isoform X1 n=1 Tax=Malus sylvestris TaxID=3752 RepID=UPI0021AD1BAF|nr:cyclase-like protein 2 isoform X1 [Malus sylvestris]